VERGMKKIVFNNGGLGKSSQSPTPQKKPYPAMPRPEEKPNTVIVWIIVAIVLLAVAGLTISAISKSIEKSEEDDSQAMDSTTDSRSHSGLWMGKWMKDHGTVSNKMLRARQQRVRDYESGRKQ